MRSRIAWLLLISTCGGGTVGMAAPYLPADDNDVLEHLPDPLSGPTLRELREQREQTESALPDAASSAAVAQRLLEQGRSSGDPRYFGYAQAALEPWWRSPSPPARIRLMRAAILQAQHEFDAALADLDVLLAADPGHLDAWLARSVILQVRGDYRGAARSCEPLEQAAMRRRTLGLAAATCTESIASLTGDAARSRQRLATVLQQSPDSPAAVQEWAATTLADISMRLGDAAAARRWFEAARSLGAEAWLLGAYADFLLTQDNAAAVVSLLADHSDVDNLLLLLTIAERAIGAAGYRSHREMLDDRFAANRLRGDKRHLREEARYELDLRDRPLDALRLARQNWSVQNEPEDLRILLRAAIASGRYESARPGIEMVERTGLDDARLTPLLAEVRAGLTQ